MKDARKEKIWILKLRKKYRENFKKSIRNRIIWELKKDEKD